MQSIFSPLLRLFATSDAHFDRATTAVERLAATTSLAPEAIVGKALVETIAQASSDLDILNYALTLEHFEDTMYRALIASGLLTGKALTYAQAYGAHEKAHVDALTATITQLGGTPVKELDKYNFPTVTSEAEVIALIATVEDVGASAYLGAAPLLQSPDLLTVGVQIHTVEAEHATTWRFLSGQDPVPFAFAPPATPADVVKIVTPFLQTPRAHLPVVIR